MGEVWDVLLTGDCFFEMMVVGDVLETPTLRKKHRLEM